jgi:hypothetical protein
MMKHPEEKRNQKKDRTALSRRDLLAALGTAGVGLAGMGVSDWVYGADLNTKANGQSGGSVVPMLQELYRKDPERFTKKMQTLLGWNVCL